MRSSWILMAILLGAALLLAACGGRASSDEARAAGQAVAQADHEAEVGHVEGDSHADEVAETHDESDHGATAHGVPEEAAEVANPVPATDESIKQGAEIYARICATCHGPNGEGDGPAASGLPVKPANFHDAHVQELTDGALFYIITHGRAESGMPAWEGTLSEEERWHVVNFIRTFGD